jgi:hypothetical protein
MRILKGASGKGKFIFSLSQPAINVSDNFRINSMLVWDCHKSLVIQAEQNVQLLWVPGHKKSEAKNQTVNQMAKWVLYTSL